MSFFSSISSTLESVSHTVRGEVEELAYKIRTQLGSEEKLDEQEDLIKRGHRFESYSPIRDRNCFVKHYIDGHDYMWAVSEALESAQETIYIEDWWMSPELHLRRPPARYPEYRLDAILKRKAEQGVKIYIVLYKEVAQALTLNSEHTKKVLSALHPNILVQRDPDHDVDGTFFWAHHEKFVVVDNAVGFMGGLDLCYGRWDTHEHRMADHHPDNTPATIFPGQDYNNVRIKDFVDVQDFEKTLIDRAEYGRMPWHDVSIGLMGPAVLDIARHFHERWNKIKIDKAMEHKEIPFLTFPGIPMFNVQLPEENDLFRREKHTLRSMGHRGPVSCQLLRSSAQWSHGINTEHSIQNAYVELIKESKHFIYIENQFFITATDSEGRVKNMIGKALVERILRAAYNKEDFKVIVVMPLLPGFEGEVSGEAAATLRLVMHWQYVSICRGGKSVYDKIRAAGFNPEDYIRFFSLRAHDKIKNGKGDASEFVTEELYIHTKLMIVDDRTVVIGSANINDRSQNGDHDSEIAIVIDDATPLPSYMNGELYQASRFAAVLRRQIFKEHLGLLGYTQHVGGGVTPAMRAPPVVGEDFTRSYEDSLVMDPLGDQFLKLWYGTAKTNTETYRSVFKVIPDDTITNWAEYKSFYPASVPVGHVADPQMSRDRIERELSAIRGHLVEFPTHFLEKENLLGDSAINDITMELYL